MKDHRGQERCGQPCAFSDNDYHRNPPDQKLDGFWKLFLRTEDGEPWPIGSCCWSADETHDVHDCGCW